MEETGIGRDQPLMLESYVGGYKDVQVRLSVNSYRWANSAAAVLQQ
jgi:hypothetical protein